MNKLLNYIGGNWEPSSASEYISVVNPTTLETLAQVPLTQSSEVDKAVSVAARAFPDWRKTPVTERIQYLFKLKNLLETHQEDIARIITLECGKTLSESMGEIRRGIENVEVASGMPKLIQGYNNEDIASGIDEHLFRQPLGVVTAITPFNFPAMIPLWFLPYAIAAGNCFILKPSEKVPLTVQKLMELVDQTGIPAGVVQTVNGNKEAVDALLDHPEIKAVSFVGSTPVAKYVYGRATNNGKRAQCQGGAKNPIVIMPDADMETTVKIAADSAFGCAGQRCLAASVGITVGESHNEFLERFSDAASNRKTGNGLEAGIEMGPVISHESRDRIHQLIWQGEKEGAKVVLDGRDKKVAGYEKGSFVLPTILDNVDPHSELARTEIFGPVFSITRVDTLDEAIKHINAQSLGNQASIFTSSGVDARKFRYEVQAGNIGINIGVAAPMAFFPFSGWGDSFFGDLHAQSHHGVEFYTQTKVVVERWPQEWSRKF
jgi:malonate-semialdehyde dehydrogenase (acetylating)/methylmalonate-semialdehyde dehydrogenase